MFPLCLRSFVARSLVVFDKPEERMSWRGGYGHQPTARENRHRYGRTERDPRYNSRERGPGRPGGIDEGGGAAKLARVHGTELDRVNCPYFYKVGACRHGEICSRRHNKPKFSQTLLVKHMWLNPQVQFLNVPNDQKPGPDEMREFQAKVQEGFNAFYEEVGMWFTPRFRACCCLTLFPPALLLFYAQFYFICVGPGWCVLRFLLWQIFQEAAKYGYLEAIHVSENLGDHMVGNVYIKYEDEADAATAIEKLQGRYYSGQPLVVEFSPVTDFGKARCRQYDDGVCARGGFCNYVHIRPPDRRMVRELFESQVKPEASSSDSSSSEDESDRRRGRDKKKKKKSRRRSRSRSRDRTGSRHSSSRDAPPPSGRSPDASAAPVDPSIAAALAAARGTITE